ncbi:hypothetical protein [Kangiella sp. HZ709]|uniref:hypothetical protein n=1 Tax=Kangiella sp. HZ709 TaxID=2666328 RepID=UPI0012B015F8|nr:hypothetical protein [Kangiella sp. HZ709]MRX26739.1 hypothetical protein [Kangiella sp. HZ709]
MNKTITFLMLTLSLVLSAQSLVAKPAKNIIDDKVIVPIGEKSILSISQRSIKAMPESKNRVKISLGDITAGQVMTSIYSVQKDSDGISKHNTLMHQTSLRRGDKRVIEFQGNHYQIHLKDLHNALLGNDKAIFVVQKVVIKPASKKSDRA